MGGPQLLPAQAGAIVLLLLSLGRLLLWPIVEVCAFLLAKPVKAADLEREMKEVMRDIGEKLPLKFKHVRDAFRSLDLSHNGKITPT